MRPETIYILPAGREEGRVVAIGSEPTAEGLSIAGETICDEYGLVPIADQHACFGTRVAEGKRIELAVTDYEEGSQYFRLYEVLPDDKQRALTDGRVRSIRQIGRFNSWNITCDSKMFPLIFIEGAKLPVDEDN